MKLRVQDIFQAEDILEAKDKDEDILNLKEVRNRPTDTVLQFEVEDKAENIFEVEDETEDGASSSTSNILILTGYQNGHI